MIYGAKKWNDRTTFSIQTNNAIEAILKKIGAPHWLETCGPTSAVNCLDALGWNTRIGLPGGGTVQSEDVLTLWLNDIKNRNEEKRARTNIEPEAFLGNEIPQYYPAALFAVFGVLAQYVEGYTFESVASELKNGRAVMLCLKNPGHFIAAVAYDEEMQEIIYRDPWPGRTGTDGFNLRMKEDEYGANVKTFAVIISPA